MFARNIALLSLSELANVLLPFVTIAYATRVLQPEGMGAFLYSWSAVAVLGNIIEWGFSWKGVQEIAHARQDDTRVREIYIDILGGRLILLAVCTTLYLGIFLIVPAWRSEWTVFACMAPSLLAATMHPAWIFRGLEKFKALALVNFIGRALSLLLIVLFVRNKDGAAVTALFTSVGAVATGISAMFLIKQFINPNYRELSYQRGFIEIKRSTNAFFSAQLIILAFNASTFAVGTIGGHLIAGQYGLAARFITVCKTLMGVIVQAGLPKFSAIKIQNELRARVLLRRLALFLVPSGIVCALVIGSNAAWIVTTLFGPGYDHAAKLIRCFAPILPLFCISMCFSSLYMFGFGYQRRWSQYQFAATIVMMMSSVLLLSLLPLDYAFAFGIDLSEATLALMAFIFFLRQRRRYASRSGMSETPTAFRENIKLVDDALIKKVYEDASEIFSKYEAVHELSLGEHFEAVHPISYDVIAKTVTLRFIPELNSLQEIFLEYSLEECSRKADIEMLFFNTGRALAVLHTGLKQDQCSIWRPNSRFLKCLSRYGYPIESRTSLTSASLHCDFSFTNVFVAPQSPTTPVIIDPLADGYISNSSWLIGPIYLDLGRFLANLEGQTRVISAMRIGDGRSAKLQHAFIDGYESAADFPIDRVAAFAFGYACASAQFQFWYGPLSFFPRTLLFSRYRQNFPAAVKIKSFKKAQVSLNG